MTLGVAFVFLLSAVSGSQFAPDTDISSTLARADAAYYDARFNDVIVLLVPTDAALEARPERADERIRVKLQLALAYIGLNEIEEEKKGFAEIYEIKSKF